MTTQKNIDYKIEQLKQLTGINTLNDKWLNDKEHPNGKSHRLELSDLGEYITPRYPSAKQFFYVLDSMVNILQYKRQMTEKLETYSGICKKCNKIKLINENKICRDCWNKLGVNEQ